MRIAAAVLLLAAAAACGRQEPAPATSDAKAAEPAAENAGANEASAPPMANNATAAAAPPAAPPAAAAPRTEPWSPRGYALNGTEPFWGGSVTGTTVRYMTPENQFGEVIEVEVSYAADRETYSGRHGGHPFVLTLTHAACSDGMSDRTYGFSATLQVGGETRRGCADPQ